MLWDARIALTDTLPQAVASVHCVDSYLSGQGSMQVKLGPITLVNEVSAPRVLLHASNNPSCRLWCCLSLSPLHTAAICRVSADRHKGHGRGVTVSVSL